ncbi:sulfite exporter TauE/SafE family protein, partial [Myxococcota bacterium]
MFESAELVAARGPSSMDFLIAWLPYAAVGAVVGILSGLLGIGGGIVTVPALSAIFLRQGVLPDAVHHLAVGTSLATIVFTSLSSMRAHNQRKAVSWKTVKRVTPGVLLGSAGGSWLAARLSTSLLVHVFSAFLVLVSVQMLLDLRPKASRALPGLLGLASAGGAIGLLSALIGVGGGSMTVPFLGWCNVEVRRAIGTSTAIGFPIAVAGSAGFIINGWGRSIGALTLGY